MSDYLAGTIRITWSISDEDAKVPPGDDDLTPAQVRALCDRIEDAVTSALPQTVDVWIDGEDEPPTRVHFDLGGAEIEIDDGPINGTLEDLRRVND